MVSVYFFADAIALIARSYMRQRSSYPKPFKAQVVQECLQPGATVSSVAINVIRKWLPVYRDQAVTTLPAFVPVQPLPKRTVDEVVVIVLPLGGKSITVKWPASDPDGCARFIRSLSQ